MDLGRVGLWAPPLRALAGTELAEKVAMLEALGYSAIWFPGGPGGTAFDHAHALLSASARMVVATGILSIWRHEAPGVAASNRVLLEAYPGRFLLGLGVSHPETVDRAEARRYQRPLEAMSKYLSTLDEADPGGGKDQRILAALGPRMLRLAAERALGAHPYFVPVEHTAAARETLGPTPVLAPEQAAVLEADPSKARAAARAHMATYLRLRNYVGNLRRLGYTEEDVAGPTDRLVDAIVAWGDEEAVGRRVRQHLDAGADHVCVQVLGRDAVEARSVPLEQWQRLAPAIVRDD